MTLAIVIVLVSLVGGFLCATGVFIANSGWEETDAKILWLAEAGLQKAIWNLKTPAAGGGQGENWATAGTTENLADGNYTMVVSRYDFALAANGATASATSSGGGTSPANAIDGSDATYWESASQPSGGNPEEIIVTFPYTLTVNKVRFLVPSGTEHAPKNYTWAVSTDGVAYTTVANISNNADRDVTDAFSASSARYLKLTVTQVGIIVPPGGPPGVARARVATLEAIGSKITSTGAIAVSGDDYTRTVVQTVVADDASPQNQVAYAEPDWAEQ